MSRIISLSEAASIGIHGIILVAQGKKLVNVQFIADATNTSRHHVAKIMQRLVKEGFLESQRGPNGGFTLKKKAKDINFLDVYEAIEGKLETTKCPLDKQICPFNKCILNNVTYDMTIKFREYLQSQTLNNYL
ncbi:MAG: Rrf2 family transcriptional regulator [Bacteroidetes bacterium HGW-Bacteroidetes-21]|jgi:Rrf2 family protein|nr:MAG: Rrf2 family transcriptional regulator [Bacteroidetes bacterium HGW-Bacteroidetes-21]